MYIGFLVLDFFSAFFAFKFLTPTFKYWMAICFQSLTFWNFPPPPKKKTETKCGHLLLKFGLNNHLTFFIAD